MRKKKTQKLPPVDPNKLIQENAAMNRVNISGPFGSQQYVTGPDGHQTLQTTLSPEMQALFTQQISRAGSPAGNFSFGDQHNQLLASLLAKANARYGGTP